MVEVLTETNSLAVGLGEIKASRNPQDELVAFGLGSCVAVAMYDPITHVAGLLHAVLPERNGEVDDLSPKYADSGVLALLATLEKIGVTRSRLVVRMVGGANMLTMTNLKNALNIGERNVLAARAVLARLNLRVAAEDVGGNKGRTVRLYVANGRMTVRVLGSETREM